MFLSILGDADVPSLLWDCDIQCPAICSFKEGIWQKQSKCKMYSGPTSNFCLLFLQIPAMRMCLLSRQLYFKNFIFKRSLSWLKQQAESVGGKYTCSGGYCFLMSVMCFVMLKQLHLWHRWCRRKSYSVRDSSPHKILLISSLCHPEFLIFISCANNVDIYL